MSGNSVPFNDEDSYDSLPDLQTRINAQSSPPKTVKGFVHTLSSDENSEDEIVEEITWKSSEELNFNQYSEELQRSHEDSLGNDVDVIPEIQDITYIGEETSPEAPPKCSKAFISSRREKKQMTSEASRAEKAMIQRQQQLLKEERAAQKAQLKAEKEKKKLLKKSLKPGECLKNEDNAEAIVVVPVAEFVALVWSQLYGEQTDKTLLDECLHWKASLERQTLTIIVCGLDSYFRDQKVNNQRQFRAVIMGVDNAPRRGQKRKKNDQNVTNLQVSRVDVETALVQIQMECDVNHRLLNDPQRLASYVSQMSKAIAQAPFKLIADVQVVKKVPSFLPTYQYEEELGFLCLHVGWDKNCPAKFMPSSHLKIQN